MSDFPQVYNFNLYQGDSSELDIDYQDDTGTGIDLTGYTATFTIARTPNVSSAALILTSPSSISLDANGNIVVTISSGNSNNLASGQYIYDLRLTTGSTVTTILRGNLLVTGKVGV